MPRLWFLGNSKGLTVNVSPYLCFRKPQKTVHLAPSTELQIAGAPGKRRFAKLGNYPLGNQGSIVKFPMEISRVTWKKNQVKQHSLVTHSSQPPPEICPRNRYIHQNHHQLSTFSCSSLAQKIIQGRFWVIYVVFEWFPHQKQHISETTAAASRFPPGKKKGGPSLGPRPNHKVESCETHIDDKKCESKWLYWNSSSGSSWFAMDIVLVYPPPRIPVTNEGL